jgi:hypothetical protein
MLDPVVDVRSPSHGDDEDDGDQAEGDEERKEDS